MSYEYYNRQSFTDAVQYNISRYQHITRTSNKKLSAVLGLSEVELESRMLNAKPWSAWEIYLCSQYLECGYDMLMPDPRLLRSDILWDIGRRLPSGQFTQLFDYAMQLVKEVEQKRRIKP